MAEMKKGEADMMNAKREGIEMQLEDANKKAEHQIKAFEAQTKRMEVEVKAHEAGAKVKKTEIETVGSHLDNAIKIKELQTGAVA